MRATRRGGRLDSIGSAPASWDGAPPDPSKAINVETVAISPQCQQPVRNVVSVLITIVEKERAGVSVRTRAKKNAVRLLIDCYGSIPCDAAV